MRCSLQLWGPVDGVMGCISLEAIVCSVSLRHSENHPSLNYLSNQVQGPEFYPERLSSPQPQLMLTAASASVSALELSWTRRLIGFYFFTSHFRHQRFLSDTVFPRPSPSPMFFPSPHGMCCGSLSGQSSYKKRLLTPDSWEPLFLTKNTRGQSRGCSSV